MTKEESNIYVGMILYENRNNRSVPDQIKERKVSKIGRKYFYCEDLDRMGFDKETLLYTNKEYHQSNIRLYRTEQEIKDIKEKLELTSKLRAYFDVFNSKRQEITLEQLRYIAKTLGI